MNTFFLASENFPATMYMGVSTLSNDRSEMLVIGDTYRKGFAENYLSEGSLELLSRNELLSRVSVTDGEAVSQEWLSLLVKDCLRYSPVHPVCLADVEEWKVNAELLASSFFKSKDLLVVLDECAIYALLYAQVRYVTFCSSKILELLSIDNPASSLLIYALRSSPRVVAETVEVVAELEELNILSSQLDNVDWNDVATKLHSHKKIDLTAFDSLKQKRCEITYEAKYCGIYDSKYHDAICYQIMDEYLVDIVDDAIDMNSNKGGVRILDLGCGPGSMVSHLMRHGNWDYYGVDISQAMVDTAKERYPALSFQVGDAENLDFQDEYFDVVLCSGMLHHLPNLENVIVEVKRVLKPGGCMISREPNEKNLAELSPSLGFLHICLKNIIHVVHDSTSIIEPEEHEYHTDFDFLSMSDVIGKHLWVDGFYTNQKTSYFYDMLMEPAYRELIGRLEDSLNGQPGLNIVAVARKSERNGVSLAVREKVDLLARTPLVSVKQHLEVVREMYDRLVSWATISQFKQVDFDNNELLNNFEVSRPALIVQNLKGQSLQVEEEDGDHRTYDMMDLPQFSDLGLHDHVKILCQENVSAEQLIKQMERCSDYGLIEIVIYPGVIITDIGESEKLYLTGLSPIPSSDNDASDDTVPHEPQSYFLSRNLFTRKNFLEALDSVVSNYGLIGDPDLSVWCEKIKLTAEAEFKVQLEAGGFYDLISGSKV